ncbi:hypothetical protein LOD99_10253 [Oopsacas minuta]|uniref:Uncharacterized protein n=1 Tax=Oopsacas minuta TaxID=111878 RepID=A0AAV7KLG5_9METZ|nr:hypothetical protein LOD99_10253 [Oopsacas minuta]
MYSSKQIYVYQVYSKYSNHLTWKYIVDQQPKIFRTAPSIARVTAWELYNLKGTLMARAKVRKPLQLFDVAMVHTHLEKRFLNIITSTHSSNNVLSFLLPDQLPLRSFTHTVQQEPNRPPTLLALCKITILNSMKNSKDRNARTRLAIIIRQSSYSSDDITKPTLTPSIVSHTSNLWNAKEGTLQQHILTSVYSRRSLIRTGVIRFMESVPISEFVRISEVIHLYVWGNINILQLKIF